jgi:hypothetical protein
MKTGIVYLIGCILFLFSCQKSADRPCFKGRGEEVVKEFSISGVSRVTLGRNIRFIIIQDSTQKAVVKTGSNLVNFVRLSKENDHLEIQNDNGCNFLRYGKNEVIVELHITSLRHIYFEGSEPLTNEGTLSWSLLYLVANDNAANIELKLNIDSLYFTNPHAWPVVNFTGESNFCQVNIQGDAKINMKNFIVKKSFSYASESSQDGEINLLTTEKFIGQLRGNGNVGYWNDAVEMYTNHYGKGTFIKKN